MLYEKELLGPQRAKLGGGLLLFKPQTASTTYLSRYYRYYLRLRQEFSHSSVHGLHHIFEPHMQLWQRYFWLLIVFLASIGCLIMYNRLTNSYNELKLVTIVEATKLPVYNIEFPAIAICPWNHINWLRSKKAEERFLPNNLDPYVKATFEELLTVMETLTFGNFERLGKLAKRNLSSISKISFMQLASFLAYRCDELFVPNSCIFDEISYDCCKLFIQERTDKGLCLVFNSMVSETSRKKRISNEKYPLKTSTAGEGSGLLFTLRLNSAFLRPGVKTPLAMNLIIKEPYQWSQSLIYHLYSNTENLISIRPQTTETSKNTLPIKPEKRHCYFEKEASQYHNQTDLPYNRQNCLAECQQEHLLEICNCTLPMFFPPKASSRECQVEDFLCLYENRDIFSYIKIRKQDEFINDPRRGMYCQCIESCYSVLYMMSLNVKLLENTSNNSGIIKGNIYYGQRVMTKYNTRLEYTYLDMLANFGGILGLFIGASALSFAELAHVLFKILALLFSDLRKYLLQTKIQPKSAN